MVDLSHFAIDTAAVPVLDFLAQSKWRRARDAAKDLCKQDKARYLPLLIAANQGLARELMARGQVNEAAQVIAYLKTIAPAEMLGDLEAAQSQSQTPSTAGPANAGPAASASGSHWASALALARVEADGPLAPADDWLAVDSLVVAENFIPTVTTDALAASVAAELAAVRQAVAATAAGDWDASQVALRVLPRQSIFLHWRMFLRGVRLAHLGDAVQAEQCFATLPRKSTPAKAATLWQKMLGIPVPASVVALDAPQDVALAAMAGASEACGKAVFKAQQHWGRQKYFDAYNALRSGLGAAFPTEKLGLEGVLTNAVLAVTAKSSTEGNWQNYAADLWEESCQKSTGKIEVYLMRKYCCRAFELDGDAELLYNDWRSVVDAAQKAYGHYPVRDSILWHEAATELINYVEGKGFYLLRPRKSHVKLAQTALANATKADPQNVDAQVALLEFCRKHGTKTEVAKQAEVMVKHLPNHKDSLREAGRLSIKRKAFAKGLDFFDRVRQLDPLDKAVQSELMDALLSQAADAAKKKPASLPEIWAKVGKLLPSANTPAVGVTTMAEALLQRWFVRAIQGALDPDADTSTSFRTEALTTAPSFVDLFTAQEIYMRHNHIRRDTTEPRVVKSLLERDANWSNILRSVQLIMSTQQIVSPGDVRAALDGVAIPVLTSVLTKPLEDDAENFRLFLTYLLTENERHPMLRCYSSLCLAPLLMKALDAKFAKSKEARWILSGQIIRQLDDNPVQVVSLEPLRSLLEKQGQPQWLPLLDATIKACKRPAFFGNFDEDDEDDEEDDEDEDDWDEDDDPWAVGTYDEADDITSAKEAFQGIMATIGEADNLTLEILKLALDAFPVPALKKKLFARIAARTAELNKAASAKPKPKPKSKPQPKAKPKAAPATKVEPPTPAPPKTTEEQGELF
jgi:hypothetical protein